MDIDHVLFYSNFKVCVKCVFRLFMFFNVETMIIMILLVVWNFSFLLHIIILTRWRVVTSKPRLCSI